MPSIIDLTGFTPDELVAQLAQKHRHKAALQRLMRLGNTAIDAVRRGLGHEDASVRVGCCKILDHHMNEAALPELIANLGHPEPEVRSWALHALACDRCKEGSCRPGEADVIPRAVDLLLHDDNRRVRTMAADMLGPSVRRSELALAAIIEAHRNDPHPMVRKVTSWWVPGGPRYKKLRGH